MEAPEHFQHYVQAFFVYIFFMALYDTMDWFFVIALFTAFFIINPDFFDKVMPPNWHRNFFSHSALFVIAGYWIFRPYINLLSAQQFGIIVFYPMIIHLLCDFFNLWKKVQGFACISFFGYYLTREQSLWYVSINIVGMCCYIIWAL